MTALKMKNLKKICETLVGRRIEGGRGLMKRGGGLRERRARESNVCVGRALGSRLSFSPAGLSGPETLLFRTFLKLLEPSRI